MCLNVNFYPNIGCVEINGKSYTHIELEEKPKSRMENAILHTLKEIMIDEEVDINQLEVQFEEVIPSMMGNGN